MWNKAAAVLAVCGGFVDAAIVADAADANDVKEWLGSLCNTL